MQTSALLYCGMFLSIVTVPTSDWGKGLVIARREEEGAVLLRVAMYSVSGGSRVGAGSVAIRRDPRLFGAVTSIYSYCSSLE